MFSNRRITSWKELTPEHLLVAYRKAKADCFFERSQCDSEEFAAFESDLASNLEFILLELQDGKIDALLAASIGAGGSLDGEESKDGELSQDLSVDDLEQLISALEGQREHPARERVMFPNFATRELVAKKLGRERRKDGSDGHAYFSRSERALKHLQEGFHLVPEFRLLGRFSVLGHVLSALWINHVGHRFDALLSDSVYGARVRRYRPEPGSLPGTKGHYHVDAPGTFPPYFLPYQRWREAGFRAIEGELEEDKPIVALTLDLSSYYHRIDPGFVALDGFQRAIGASLNEFEKSFTSSLASSLHEWSQHAATDLVDLGCGEGDAMGGIPIGLSCTRVLANLLLFQLDQEIRRELAPIYYGRYVDDIFLVLSDTWDARSAPSIGMVFDFIAKRIPLLTRDNGDMRVEFAESYGGSSRLLFQTRKQKLFFLDGRAGLDLLGSIQQHICEVASERRLMPDPDRLEESAAAQVLTAAGDVAEEADSLRRADGLSVRRLGWSVQLRNVETLARDLRAPDWHKQRKTFYEFARNHVIRPDRLLDHLDYLPRLIALAVSLEDWVDARRLYESAEEALSTLSMEEAKEHKVNGCNVRQGRALFEKLRMRTRRVCADAVLRSLPWARNQAVLLSRDARSFLFTLALPLDQNAVEARALALREADLARTSYVEHVRFDAEKPCVRQSWEAMIEAAFPPAELAALKEFLRIPPQLGQEGCARLGESARRLVGDESIIPYICPTRPYSARAIALHDPECVSAVDASSRWARFVRAARGVWVTPQGEDDHGGDGYVEPAVGGQTDGTSETAPEEQGLDQSSGQASRSLLEIRRVGRRRKPTKVVLGITSLRTPETTWTLAAENRADLGLERYKRVQEIVNRAVDSRPRVTHLLLPELALPARWVDSIVKRLQMADISLIAGLDYFHIDRTLIYSEALLVLSDDRLGFPSCIEIRQAKGVPARGEEEELARLFEKVWPEGLAQQRKPVYSHHGFDFGVLVCSELQNIRHRSRFQGQVDCLMILAWNKDIETFSALVEAAALDVHAYVALVNNRQYGDSRVRSPAKAAYRRDLCRLQGGRNDFLAVVELDLQDLRAFQSRAKAWAKKEDPFKPVPEGFKIAKRRRVAPK